MMFEGDVKKELTPVNTNLIETLIFRNCFTIQGRMFSNRDTT